MLLRSTLLLALTTGAALAEPVVVDRAVLKQYCTGDYLTYCGNLSPDGPEVQAPPAADMSAAGVRSGSKTADRNGQGSLF